jgi:hypothetical protein
MSKEIISINDAPEFTLSEKLSRIQFEFKAKKTSYNKFGNYYFRSAESILEALKPFNQKYKVYFTINEQLVNSNPPIMTSVATIWDCESPQSIDCQAVVGVDLEQKGMAMPQRYGSSSSYGKKYALGNLLLIDDTADADATNKHEKEVVTPKVQVKVEKPIEKPVLEIDTDAFNGAKMYIENGVGTIESIEKKYTLTEQVKQALLNNK